MLFPSFLVANTTLENQDIDIEKYFDEKTNPIVNADTYLIWNKNDNEHFFKNKSFTRGISSFDILWVIIRFDV